MLSLHHRLLTLALSASLLALSIAVPQVAASGSGAAASGANEEACFSERAFTDLDEMDKLLSKVRKKFKDGELDGRRFRDDVREIEGLKHDLIRKHMSAVFGGPFADFYDLLERIDLQLIFARQDSSSGDRKREDVVKDLNRARGSIVELIRLLESVPEAPSVPAAALTDLDIMEDLLRKIKQRFKDGKLDGQKFRGRVSQVEDLKRALIRDHFPSVCGRTFGAFYHRLERIDLQLIFARQDSIKQKVVRDLDGARRALKGLRKLMESASEGGGTGGDGTGGDEGTSAPACSDGIDNDDDGTIDHAGSAPPAFPARRDPACEGNPTRASEAPDGPRTFSANVTKDGANFRVALTANDAIMDDSGIRLVGDFKFKSVHTFEECAGAFIDLTTIRCLRSKLRAKMAFIHDLDPAPEGPSGEPEPVEPPASGQKYGVAAVVFPDGTVEQDLLAP